MMFCFHKWDSEKDRYQVCKKCGLKRPIKCAHKWIIISSQMLGPYSTAILQCEICGDVKKQG